MLVTGISGFLGYYVAQRPAASWQILGTYRQHQVATPGLETYAADLSETTNFHALLDQLKPDAVLHLAALANTSYCEQHPQASQQINYQSTVHLAEYCAARQIPMVFSSTDLVFDGKNAPYQENSPVSPINQYGKHKMLAEQKIRAIYPNVCIARLPLMYGLDSWGNSFLSHWVAQWQAGKEVGAFTDEYRTAASGRAVAEGLLLLLEKEAQGIWHLGGAERLSRYDFALQAARHYGFPAKLVRAAKQSDFQFAAARSPDVSLDSSKAFALGYAPLTLAEELEKGV